MYYLSFILLIPLWIAADFLYVISYFLSFAGEKIEYGITHKLRLKMRPHKK